MFPSHFKHAHVNPLLKKPSLPANDLNTNIPISNLSFMSKVLEKVVFGGLNVHLNSYHLFKVFQSAYKQFYSIEHALLKVHNDTSLNMDTGKATALTLLDISAAFDSIDYSVLLDRLSAWYDIYGTAFTWVRSFLTNRFHSIRIRNCFSKAIPLFCVA